MTNIFINDIEEFNGIDTWVNLNIRIGDLLALCALVGMNNQYSIAEAVEENYIMRGPIVELQEKVLDEKIVKYPEYEKIIEQIQIKLGE